MVSVIYSPSEVAINASPYGRNFALDFVKGMLVIIMVIYHTMNILTTAGPDDYAYVRFVSGSFILISGYIVSKFYNQPFRANWSATTHKLLIRGAKLIALFTALNLAISMTGVGNPVKINHGALFDLRSLWKIYVVGEPQLASFQILLPIGYLLLLAPVFLRLRDFAAVCLAVMVAIALLLSFIELPSVNLEFLLLGAIGATGGIVIEDSGLSVSIKQVTVIGAGFLATILFMRFASFYFLPYVVGTVAILKLLYDLGGANAFPLGTKKAIIALGRYSLFCYIAQILILQMIARILPGPKFALGVEFFFACGIVTGLLILLCAVLERVRVRSAYVDRAYRLVFA